MGHHYVPQRYLRNFEVGGQPGIIWQYAKKDGQSRCLPIKNVAQSRDFYAPDMESFLAAAVEPQGSRAFEKLLGGKGINSEERLDLAVYLGVAMMRVRMHRRRVSDMVPDVLSSVIANFRESVQRAAKEIEVDPARVSSLLRDADRIEEKYEAEPPQSVEDLIRDPLPSPLVLGAILTMNWRLCVSDGPQWFITSDNPFFFTTGMGLGNPDSEFFLPLSPRHLLLGSRKQPARGIPRCKMPQRVVKQVNKLTIVEAANFVFSDSQYSWLPAVLAVREHWTFRPAWRPKDL